MEKLIGFCKECGLQVKESDNLSDIGHENIYECSHCGHPHTINELWSTQPYYIKDNIVRGKRRELNCYEDAMDESVKDILNKI